jgi:hypothetical protein
MHYAKEVRDVLCLLWQDNNIVLVLSRVHIVDKFTDLIEHMRKRPSKSSTNAADARAAFRDDYQKPMVIPCFIHDYNTNM